MNFWQFLGVLKARWKIALSIFLATVLTAVAVSLIVPKKYTATASVVVDLKTPDPITGMVLQGMMSASIMATQMDVIQSPRTAKRVIEQLRLNESADLRNDWLEATKGRGAIEDWLADLLLRQLDVRPARESNVLFIGYKSGTPEFSQALANGFAQAYIDTTLALRVQPAREYSKFFEGQARQVREVLESAQAKLSSYQQKKGLLVSDERLDVENSRLSELTLQLVNAQSQAAESKSRQTQAATAGSQLQEVTNHPVIYGLKSQLAQQQAKLSELRNRYGESHPQVQELVASIKETQSRLNQETHTLTSGVRTTNQVNLGRVAQIEASIAEQRAKVLKMKADRDEAAVLQRDVENAQRAYDAVVNRANQSGLEAQTQQSNVSMLNPAALPIEPSSPKMLLNLALAVFVGGLLALATALLLEVMDRRLRSSSDVIAVVGLPVLGTLPRPNFKRVQGTRRSLLSRKSDNPPVLTRLTSNGTRPS